MIRWTVNPGEEVLTALQAHAERDGIKAGAVVSLIGAVESARISNMPAGDAGSDVVTDLTQPFELSGSGEIVDGTVHLHVTLSGEGNAAVHGHLHAAQVETWYVAAYVLPL
jgi:predicted DNA-binding protein with PD1-like motif